MSAKKIETCHLRHDTWLRDLEALWYVFDLMSTNKRTHAVQTNGPRASTPSPPPPSNTVLTPLPPFPPLPLPSPPLAPTCPSRPCPATPAPQADTQSKSAQQQQKTGTIFWKAGRIPLTFVEHLLNNTERSRFFEVSRCKQGSGRSAMTALPAGAPLQSGGTDENPGDTRPTPPGGGAADDPGVGGARERGGAGAKVVAEARSCGKSPSSVSRASGGGGGGGRSAWEVYCDGPLLKAVQLARLFPDCKTFVDMPMKQASARACG